MLEAKGIHKSYGNLEVLRGVELSVAAGEIVSIVGSSGAGKSTLLHILGSLDKADAGSITIAGKNLQQLSGSKLAAFRNEEIGFIFQFHHSCNSASICLRSVMLKNVMTKPSILSSYVR